MLSSDQIKNYQEELETLRRLLEPFVSARVAAWTAAQSAVGRGLDESAREMAMLEALVSLKEKLKVDARRLVEALDG